MNPYYPHDKPAQAAWYLNMSEQFPAVGTALGFSAAEITAWVNDCVFAHFLLSDFSGLIESFSTGVTGYVQTVVNGPATTAPVTVPTLTWPPTMPTAVDGGIDGRRQKIVDRIKAAPGYTPLVIGNLLRTEPTGSPFDPATYQGVIRSAIQNGQGQVVIAFAKAGGNIDGVNLYLQRKGDAAPVKVGQFTHTPAVDLTPLAVPGTPEQRTYTVVPVIKDLEVGLPSAPVVLVVR